MNICFLNRQIWTCPDLIIYFVNRNEVDLLVKLFFFWEFDYFQKQNIKLFDPDTAG